MNLFLRHRFTYAVICGIGFGSLAGLQVQAASTPSQVSDWTSESYLVNESNVDFELPTNWISTEDLFGIPLTFLGPEDSDGRAVVLVSPLRVPEWKFTPAMQDQFYTEYQAGRKASAEAEGRVIESFDPLMSETWKSGAQAYCMGYRSGFLNQTFIERSCYVFCHDFLYHIKSLIRGSQETKYGKTVESVTKSFGCGGE